MKGKDNKARRRRPAASPLPKCPTGIRGLDEITNGGLPRGRPTLICGVAGCGKTVMAMEFLVRGAMDYGEPGVFISFEERADELEKNFSSLGIDIGGMIRRRQLAIDYIHVERSEIEETGQYDLEALFIRVGYAITATGAKRVVLDTIEALFAGLGDTAILRAELRRLFRWLKDRGVTAVITAERGEGSLTRQGLEEYVADCVILLDARVKDQITTRRLRVVKYRGTAHGADEYPFLIDEGGVSILPVTSLGLRHKVSSKRVSTGVERLDTMLGGAGYYRGSTILVSGTAGSGKSTLCAKFVEAACRRGERCLYFAFEESEAQILRNMRSVGCNLEPFAKKGLLRFHCSRPSVYGLEMHLVSIHNEVARFNPAIVALDPISNLAATGTGLEAKSMLTRLIDFMKMRGVTTMLTDLTSAGHSIEGTTEQISSLIDTWLCLRDLEYQGERNRGLYVLKSRGMDHSKQVREFVLSSRGVEIVDVYAGAGEVLAGSARLARDAVEKATSLKRRQEMQRKKRGYARQKALLEAKIAAMRLEFESATEEQAADVEEESMRNQAAAADRGHMARSRGADRGGNRAGGGR